MEGLTMFGSQHQDFKPAAEGPLGIPGGARGTPRVGCFHSHGGPPQWLVYNGKSYTNGWFTVIYHRKSHWNGWFRGTPIVGNPQISGETPGLPYRWLGKVITPGTGTSALVRRRWSSILAGCPSITEVSHDVLQKASTERWLVVPYGGIQRELMMSFFNRFSKVH